MPHSSRQSNQNQQTSFADGDDAISALQEIIVAATRLREMSADLALLNLAAASALGSATTVKTREFITMKFKKPSNKNNNNILLKSKMSQITKMIKMQKKQEKEAAKQAKRLEKRKKQQETIYDYIDTRGVDLMDSEAREAMILNAVAQYAKKRREEKEARMKAAAEAGIEYEEEEEEEEEGELMFAEDYYEKYGYDYDSDYDSDDCGFEFRSGYGCMTDYSIPDPETGFHFPGGEENPWNQIPYSRAKKILERYPDTDPEIHAPEADDISSDDEDED